MLWLKFFHVSTVIITVLLFIWRWRLFATGKTPPHFLKWLPHLNDSLLLFSGIAMVWLHPWNLLDNGWLPGKISLLLVYIYLGTKAMHNLKSTGGAKQWGIAALGVYILMVSLAILKPGM